MRDRSNKAKELAGRFLDWIRGVTSKGQARFRRRNPWDDDDGGKLPTRKSRGKKLNLEQVSQNASRIRLALLVLGLWLLASLVASLIGTFVRPNYTSQPRRSALPPIRPTTPTENYQGILSRNMFNVEGTIPEPFDQGKLDCFSQAKLSGQRLTLLGTIVVNDEARSAALIQDETAGEKIGVKKDEVFSNGKYTAMKIERKKFCFQVRSTQEFEYIEIPEEGEGPGSPTLTFGGGSGGIVPKSSTEFVVEKKYLESSLTNLNEILQTAKAVPNFEPSSGKMNGFLVQSVDANSPFAQLGVQPNDLILDVSGIPMDNPGRGLEAFQKLRTASNVTMRVRRGGQDVELKYDLKN